MTKLNKWACKRCKKGIVPKVKWQEYCSDKCRMIAWAIRHLEAEGYKVVQAE